MMITIMAIMILVMMLLMMMVIRSQVGVGCQQLAASRSQSIRKKEVSAIDQHNDNDYNSDDDDYCDHLDHHHLNQLGRRRSLQLIGTMIMIKMFLLIIIILMIMIIQVQSNGHSRHLEFRGFPVSWALLELYLRIQDFQMNV